MSTVQFPDERSKQVHNLTTNTNLKAFLEAQDKLTLVSRQIGKLAQQNASAERECKHSEITLKELDSYQDSTISFKSVGKIFMRHDLSDLKSELVGRMTLMKKESTAYERAAEKLKGDLTDTQELIKDIMAVATRV